MNVAGATRPISLPPSPPRGTPAAAAQREALPDYSPGAGVFYRPAPEGETPSEVAPTPLPAASDRTDAELELVTPIEPNSGG